MKEITEEYAITKKMVKMVKMAMNMMANKEWKTNSTKNRKVVALTTEVSALKKRLSNTESKFKTGDSNKPPPSRGGRTALFNMRSADLWRVTKEDAPTIMHNGVEHEWCPLHKSKDASIEGSYMKIPHDHYV